MASLASSETLVDDWVDLDNAKDLALWSKQTHDTDLYQRLNAIANQRLKEYPSPIFVTDLDPRQLYTRFHDALPEHMKQEYSCTSCRGFVRRYGGLALVDDAGFLKPLLWDPEDAQTDPVFHSSIVAIAKQFECRKVVKEIKVTEIKRQKMQKYSPRGYFNHMYLSMPDARIFKKAVQGFAPASTTKLANILDVVIKAYSIDTIRRVAQILDEVSLPQANNHKAAARWLLELLENDRIKRNGLSDSTARHNLSYRYAASAFTGCILQLSNGVLTKLLWAIETGESREAIEKQWNQVIDSRKDLKPQAFPKASSIAAFERLFNQLGITENDLRRRFLVFEDIPKSCIMWQSYYSDHTISKKLLKLFASVKPKALSTIAARIFPQHPPPTPITFTSSSLPSSPQQSAWNTSSSPTADSTSSSQATPTANH